MAEGEDCPPPLEDMTDVIKRISAIRAKVDNQLLQTSSTDIGSLRTILPNNSTPISNSVPIINAQQSTKPKIPNCGTNTTTSTNTSGFCGLKKGFLSGGLDVKKSPVNRAVDSTPKANSCDMPHIKANPSKAEEHLVMHEVQKMREQLQKTDAWLTEDLLNKLGSNDKLMAMMSDPRCERALQEFQINPDKALITYQHDKYIQEFFREFCDVLGNHYENLHEASIEVAKAVKGEPSIRIPPTTERKEELIKEVKSARKQTPPKSAVQLKKEAEEEARLKQVLSNPQLVEILKSDNIMELIRSLKEDPEQAQRLLQQGGKEFQEKVRVLVDYGLLAFQR